MKRSNISVYIAVSLIVIAANFYLSWKIFLPKYKTTKNEIAQSNVEIESARDKLDSLKTAQASINDLGDVLDKMLTAMPEDVDMPNLISELEALSLKHNMIIPAIQIADSNSTAPSSANSVPITFSSSGDYNTLTQFLISLEKDIRYMNAKAITLSMGGEDKISMTLQLEAFKRANTSLSSSSAASPSASTGAASAGLGGEE